MMIFILNKIQYGAQNRQMKRQIFKMASEEIPKTRNIKFPIGLVKIAIKMIQKPNSKKKQKHNQKNVFIIYTVTC